MSERLLKVSWGWGVNSTAMIVGFHERGIAPDIILAADTGGEKPETYAYLEVFNRYLSSIGFPLVTAVKNQSIHASLEENCLTKNMLPSLAYGFKGCSDKWKRRPQDKFMNNYPPAKEVWRAGERVICAIGYDAGELRRAKKTSDEKYNYYYPLIDWGWYREDCVSAIERAGLPIPEKSACFFCPASKKPEIIQLARTHPDLMKRALAMEDNAMSNLQTVKGLGRSFSWREFVEGRDSSSVSSAEIDIPCDCFDQEED